MKAGTIFQALLWIIYPVAILFGLLFFEPRLIAGLLALPLLFRWRHNAIRLLADLSRLDVIVLIALLALVTITVVTNSEFLLRLYPAAMSGAMLLLFGCSLKHPPSMVERFARLHDPALPASGVIYTYRVTQVWCLFFIINGGLGIYTALYSSREIWALYNGLIAYLLMGVLFAGEWLIRRHFITRPTATPDLPC